MQPITLRKYQKDAIKAAKQGWGRGKQKLLVVMPTGTGKTIVFAKLIEEVVSEGGRVLILAHRVELLKQARDKLVKTTTVRDEQVQLGVELAEDPDTVRVVISSFQALTTRYYEVKNGKEYTWQRMEEFPEDYFDLIIVDEAHHALSAGYQSILSYFSSARVLGVTATPSRGDMKSLGDYFEEVSFNYSFSQAIQDGWICPVTQKTVPMEIDISKVRLRGNDFSADDLSEALRARLKAIAVTIARECSDRKTVVFVPGVKTGKALAEILCEEGLPAVEVDGARDYQRDLQAFRDGKYRVIVNALLLTEGWDCPEVDCVVLLRPTTIPGFFQQMVGRGTRVCEGKKDLLILDFLWKYREVQPCRASVLLCGDKEIQSLMDRMLQLSQETTDILTLYEDSKEEYAELREEAIFQSTTKAERVPDGLVSPEEYAALVGDSDLLTYTACFGWEKAPASDAIKAQIQALGVYPEPIQGTGLAYKILNSLLQRRQRRMATPMQLKMLAKKGHRSPGRLNMEKASVILFRDYNYEPIQLGYSRNGESE